jgi:hypothetical protein
MLAGLFWLQNLVFLRQAMPAGRRHGRLGFDEGWGRRH